MIPRLLSCRGAIAVPLALSVAGCTPATIGVARGTILSTVIASIPATKPDTRPTAPSRARIPASATATAAAARVLRMADAYVGVPYVWGGNTPSKGFDCSGFTKFIFAKYGIALPRTSREQAHAGVAVPNDFHSLHPGDLMLFAEPGQAISHVAIYAGNGRIIHASSAVGGVGYTDLNTGGDWFIEYFVAARRVL